MGLTKIQSIFQELDAPKEVPSSENDKKEHGIHHSEVSSSDFNSHMPPEELLKGFRQHVLQKQKGQGHSDDQGHGHRHSQARGTSTSSKSKKHGLLSEYEPKPGTAYYRDLAGNIKQVRKEKHLEFYSLRVYQVIRNIGVGGWGYIMGKED